VWRGFILLPEFKEQESNLWCSVAMSKTIHLPLLCPVVLRWHQGPESQSIAVYQKVHGKKWERKARFMAHFSIIVENIGASCSGEVPKISCPHLPAALVSGHFSLLFSQGICNDHISHLLGSHSPAMESGSGPWIPCFQSLTL